MVLAQACLKDVFHTICGFELDIGLIVVLQTAGRSGHYNPHLHILLSSGGITDNGTWHQISYIPYELLHRKWQFHLLGFLKEQLPPSPELQRDIDRAWKDFPKGFVSYVQPGDVPAGGKGIAKYLAKYVVSPPISIRRIEAYSGQFVSYWYRDHKTKKVQHETIPADNFIGRMVQHILPKGFQRIRYYGFHSNPRYDKMRTVIKSILPTDIPDDPNGFRVIPRKKFRQLSEETFGKDPLKCPICGNIMELESIWHPDHGFILDTVHDFEYFNTG